VAGPGLAIAPRPAPRGPHTYAGYRIDRTEQVRWDEWTGGGSPDGGDMQEAEYREARPREREPTPDFRWVSKPATFFDPGPPSPPLFHRAPPIRPWGPPPTPPPLPRPPPLAAVPPGTSPLTGLPLISLTMPPYASPT